MDERVAMPMSGGSAQYYMHRGGIGGTCSAAQAGGFHSPPGFRDISIPNAGQAQSNVQGGSSFLMEPSHAHTNCSHSMNVAMSSQSEPVKRKRGRPRKYAPDGPGLGSMSLRLPSTSAPNPSSSMNSPTPKRSRGRPPGSGRKQQLAALGDWMNSSAGIAFAPHVVHAVPGEDIAAKILSFAQQRPRAVCILSGSGTVSSVTLKQPTSSEGNITYQGRFEILCLSGSYLVAEESSRAGGLSVSLSGPEGHVVGGAVDMLIAASLVQVVLSTFVYGGGGGANKSKQLMDKTLEPQPGTGTGNFIDTPMNGWSGSQSVDIDLMRG